MGNACCVGAVIWPPNATRTTFVIIPAMKPPSHPLWFILLLIICFNVACLGPEPYRETFDSRGDSTWATDDRAEVFGNIANGVYQFTVKEPNQMYWATAGQFYGDGTYEVEVRQTTQTTTSGYGLLIRVSHTGAFYRLGVDGLRNVTMDRCEPDCVQYEALVGLPWMFSPAVDPDAGAWNHLKIEIEDGELTFYVNDEQVGAAADSAPLASGDIGLFIETSDEDNVTVWFDNVKYTPPEN